MLGDDVERGLMLGDGLLNGCFLVLDERGLGVGLGLGDGTGGRGWRGRAVQPRGELGAGGRLEVLGIAGL